MPNVGEHWEDDDAPISLGDGGETADEPDLGPDEHDRDLMDGSWEQRYYAGHQRSVDWHAVTVAVGLLALLGITLPAVLVFFRG